MQGPGERGRRREHGEFQKGKCEWREVELCGGGLSETSRVWLNRNYQTPGGKYRQDTMT